MFTLEQIKSAHSKVKSGADFPKYIQALILLGVVRYESFVADGHTLYLDSAGRQLLSGPKYATLTIAGENNKEQYQKDLKEHQQGQTDYLTFCQISARSGVEKWIVDLSKMSCTYYDKAGREILVEIIPSV